MAKDAELPAGAAGPSSAAKPAIAPVTAKFLTGSTMRHIVIMTSAATLGLMAIFIVDVVNIFFLGLLGDVEVVSAVGYGSLVLFFVVSLGIGLSIGASALVSRAIGAGERERARRLATHALFYTFVLAASFALLMWMATPALLAMLGAKGRTGVLAQGFLDLTMISVPALAIGMCASGILRAVGDARRSMNVTLLTGLMNAGLDPLLILYFGWGLSGAAIAMVISRAAMMLLGLWYVSRNHGLIDWSRGVDLRVPELRTDLAAINAVAIPAILTNLATPVSNAYTTAALSPYGEETMAGWAVLGRIAPVALCGLFALSGAVGPIIGQNLGGRQYERVRQTLDNALIFCALYTLGAWVVLGTAQGWIARTFNAAPDGAQLIAIYCLMVVPLSAFWGALFVANACFNNLGKAHYATLFNWGRATLGTIPFVLLGDAWFGSGGVIVGSMVGSALFGVTAVLICYRLIASAANSDKS